MTLKLPRDVVVERFMTKTRSPVAMDILRLELIVPVAHSSRMERPLMSPTTAPRRLAVQELLLFLMNPPTLGMCVVERS